MSDYRAQGVNGGLSVEQGVSVTIIEKSPNGWWYCKIGNEEGWVPSSYLERREKIDYPEVAKPVVPKPVVSRPGISKPAPAAKPGVKKTVVPKPRAPRPGGASPGVGKPAVAKRTETGDDYIAISDYLDNDILNISLKEGAPVKVLEKSNSGWWYVQSCGAEGWAPSTYLAEKSKEKPKPPVKTRLSNDKLRPQNNRPLSHVILRPQTDRPPPARPAPPARPQNIRSGVKKDGPPIPSRVKKPTLTRNHNTGSTENISRFKAPTPLKQTRSTENLARPISTQYYHVIASYSDDSPDALDIKRGERVEVMKKDEGGWWLARIGNRTGWVPSNYLQ